MTGTSTLVLAARVVGSLVVVLVIAFLAARAARRAGGRTSDLDLRVVDRIGLTREAAAVVLEAGGRRLLLGVTPQGVRLLADLAVPGMPASPAPPIGGPPATQPPALQAASSWPLGSLPRQPGPQRRLDGPPPAADPDPAQLVGEPGAGLDGSGADGPDETRPPAVITPLLTRRAVREAAGNRRLAVPPTQRGSGSALDPRTWRQGVEALRDLTARRG